MYATPQHFADGTPIPPALLRQVPDEPPTAYLTDRAHRRDLAREVFGELPELEHAVVITDVLGGVRRVRCFDVERAMQLMDVAKQVVAEAQLLDHPAGLLYLTCADAETSAFRRQWNRLLYWHPESPYLLDVVVVSLDRAHAQSCSELFDAPCAPVQRYT